MDWTNPIVSQSTKEREREIEMSSLVVGFAIHMRKLVANA